MGSNVFDRVARDYEEIHNRSLPPGVCSDEFVRQKAPVVTEWILNKITSQPFCYLDYGCGNGRLFKLLVESDPLRPLIEKGSLRLFGFDTSEESLRAARAIVGDERV